jgi:hypothetical protein
MVDDSFLKAFGALIIGMYVIVGVCFVGCGVGIISLCTFGTYKLYKYCTASNDTQVVAGIEMNVISDAVKDTSNSNSDIEVHSGILNNDSMIIDLTGNIAEMN